MLAIVISALMRFVDMAVCESPSPSVHWGAMAYPDAYSIRTVGATINRFTEFDNDRNRYNPIDTTMGFNFATLSWTEHWETYRGWSTNFTIGAGPTRDQPTRFLQNDLMHRPLGLSSVPVDKTRSATDFMIDASLTRWVPMLGNPNVGFIGGGTSVGTIYYEPFLRAGARRLAIGERVRVSAMGRYGRPFGSSALGNVAAQSMLGQASFAVGRYGADNSPLIELEAALTYDKGLFRGFDGKAHEEFFLSLAFRKGPFTLEI